MKTEYKNLIQEYQSEKIDCTQFSRVAIDAEWTKILTLLNIESDKNRILPQMQSRFLMKQFTFLDDQINPQLTVILWDDSLTLPTKLPESDHPIKLIPCAVHNTVLKDVCTLPKKLLCYMFYSPKDLEAMVGTDVWRGVLLSPNSPITKQRNINGKFELDGTEYTIKDCFGAFNKGLDQAMLSAGVINPYKDNVTKCGHTKDRMDRFMKEFPNEALEYGFGDTAFLGKTLQERIQQVNEIIHQALGPVITYDIDTFPMSSGSLVAKTFEAWLSAAYPRLMIKVLKLTDTGNNKYWKDLRTIKDSLNKLDQKFKALAKTKNQQEEEKAQALLKKINSSLRGENYVHGLAMGSIRNYVLLSQNTGLFGAMVQGGRCVNEEPHQNPFQNRIKWVIDIDMSSCYGRALSKFDYPFGIPTIRENGRDDVPKKLGETLEELQDELIPGLYQIIVKGRLSFEQDLIHSKYELTTTKIQKTIYGGNFQHSTESIGGREIEAAHLEGEFLLTKNQIENGIITHEVLQIINKVPTNQEKKEFMDLEVVSVTYYPKSLEVSVDDWVEEEEGKKLAKGDERSRKWCRISLSNFIDKFIQYRDSVKKQKQQKGDRYDLLQEAVKLFINTTYGDLAAPYFPMGNTILANNITAKARVGVWMLSKTLLTVQSITDGGMFSWKRVAQLRGDKKPGIHTFADRQRLLDHRGIKLVSLTGKDVWQWMQETVEKDDKASQKELNKLCLDWINEFWSNYGLTFPFDIECKHENTSKEAVYFGSGDYLLSETVDGEKERIKCRGAKEDNHPKKQWLRHLLNPQQNSLPDPRFEYTELIGVNDFLDYPDNEVFQYLLPGDEISKETYHRPYTNGEIYSNWKEFKKVKDARDKAIRRHRELVNTEENPEKWYFYLAKQAKEGKFKLN